jgi:hypothetical protein
MIGGRTALGVVAHPRGSGMRVRQSLVGRTAGPQRTIMESRFSDGFRASDPVAIVPLQCHNFNATTPAQGLRSRPGDRPSRPLPQRLLSRAEDHCIPGIRAMPLPFRPVCARQPPAVADPAGASGRPGRTREPAVAAALTPPLVHWGERGGRRRLWCTESILGRTKSSGTPDEWPRSPAASGGSAFSGRVAFGGPIPVVPAPSIPRR